MTEPNEPKIVHFSPRAQAPVQDTAGNWEPNEQLFGLEELLQQLPPIRKLHLEKGRLTDLAGAWSCCSSARTTGARRAMRS